MRRRGGDLLGREGRGGRSLDGWMLGGMIGGVENEGLGLMVRNAVRRLAL